MGDILSTEGVFSNVRGLHEYCGGYLEYHGDTQYHGAYQDARGDIMSTVGVFSTMGDTILCNLSTVGGHHDTCGDIMSTVGVFSTMGVLK